MNKYLSLLFAGVLAVAAVGCDLLDPTNTENPNLTEDNVLGTPKPMQAWVKGLERQAAVAFNNFVVEAELTSDNYVNTNTFFDQDLDALTIVTTNSNVQNALFALSDLRESAVYGRTVVAEADPEHTPEQLAEVLFYEAVAHTFLGELFRLSPMTGGGEARPGADHFNRASEALAEALALQTDADKEAGYQILLARVRRNLGDKAGAVQAAQAALAADPTYLRYVEFESADAAATNTMQDALYDRGGFDDLQPLPRLDFLDPKFFSLGADDMPIPLVKAEEAYLIQIEAALADGQLAQAQGLMKALLALVAERPVGTVNDAVEDRTQRNPDSRPNAPDWKVQASPADPAVEGLVLARKDGDVTVPTVSGTSVTEADVDALAGIDAAVELLYLLRQEIFFAEGRRMADLGIKWILPEREILSNPNVTEGEATTPLIPPFLPVGTELDAFRVDAAAKTATILHNLNRVIAQNRTSELIAPFF